MCASRTYLTLQSEQRKRVHSLSFTLLSLSSRRMFLTFVYFIYFHKNIFMKKFYSCRGSGKLYKNVASDYWKGRQFLQEQIFQMSLRKVWFRKKKTAIRVYPERKEKCCASIQSNLEYSMLTLLLKGKHRSLKTQLPFWHLLISFIVFIWSARFIALSHVHFSLLFRKCCHACRVPEAEMEHVAKKKWWCLLTIF